MNVIDHYEVVGERITVKLSVLIDPIAHSPIVKIISPLVPIGSLTDPPSGTERSG